MADPLILVTNDDGVHAPGHPRARARRSGRLGEVWVVAPDREASASGQSLTLKHPLRAEKVDDARARRRRHARRLRQPRDREAAAAAADASWSPASTAAATSATTSSTRARWARAREATFFGVPAIAVSLAARADLDYAPGGRVRAAARRAW